jgi:glycosyltransferase involved in cell wall biosynthesis
VTSGNISQSANRMPEITLCIPTFNRGAKALKNILSIKDKIAKNIEILVLNNCSNNE